MNELIKVGAVSMNSKEIADLVNKPHRNVLRTIRMLIKGDVIRSAQSEFIERINNLGFKVKDEVYVFTGEQGKRDSIVVVAQLSPEFTARLVDRWQELEQQNAKPQLPDFTDPVAAARAWADECEQKLLAQEQVKLMAPKAAIVDEIVINPLLRNASMVAKPLGMSARKLNTILESLDVYDNSTKRARLFKQWFIDDGLGEMKLTSTGFEQALFTAKGQAWITQKIVYDHAGEE